MSTLIGKASVDARSCTKSCHHLSPSVTICHHLSPSVTIHHISTHGKMKAPSAFGWTVGVDGCVGVFGWGRVTSWRTNCTQDMIRWSDWWFKFAKFANTQWTLKISPNKHRFTSQSLQWILRVATRRQQWEELKSLRSKWNITTAICPKIDCHQVSTC